LAGQRIDRVVALLGDVSRSEAAELIADGAVTVDEVAPAKPSERVDEGARVVFSVSRHSQTLEPDPHVDFEVVYEDAAVLVVDKPAGLIVHPGSGAHSGTMVHGLLARYPEIGSVGAPERPGIVHRLDKGTSGLLLVARTEPALAALSRQLAERSVLRRYLTLVWGALASAEGLIDAPIGRSKRESTKQAVVVDGRDARTRYAVLESFEEPECTLLACRLETGRTHQIRVHLDAIDHPVVGDDRYGARPDRMDLERPFLHAETLGFEHPDSGEWMQFTTPLPADLDQVLRRLRG
jgi:23S rRNA pseudouridine1911/1915/1917 synthase